jgi:hypothetical protein
MGSSHDTSCRAKSLRFVDSAASVVVTVALGRSGTVDVVPSAAEIGPVSTATAVGDSPSVHAIAVTSTSTYTGIARFAKGRPPSVDPCVAAVGGINSKRNQSSSRFSVYPTARLSAFSLASGNLPVGLVVSKPPDRRARADFAAPGTGQLPSWRTRKANRRAGM